jgi:hypothetical protein
VDDDDESGEEGEDYGHRTQDTEHRTQNTGHRIQDTEYRRGDREVPRQRLEHCGFTVLVCRLPPPALDCSAEEAA